MSGDPRVEEHLQKTEEQRDPLGRKHDAAEAVADQEAEEQVSGAERPREPAPNPTQQRMDAEGLSRQPVDIPWWRRLLVFRGRG
jgi:hypothetical protein